MVVNPRCQTPKQQEKAPFPEYLLKKNEEEKLSRQFSKPDRCQSTLVVRVNNYSVAKGSDLRISAKVCTHIGRNGSSIESATAMNARMIGSESGTVPEPATSCGLRRWEPTATI